MNKRYAETLTDEDKELEIEFVYNLRPDSTLTVKQDEAKNRALLIFLMAIFLLAIALVLLYIYCLRKKNVKK